MKNADMPAMPFVDFDYDGHAAAAYHGLTKREHFAAMAMQAMIEAAAYKHPYSPEILAQQSIGMADALLGELERTS
ncbi:hypothetical protein [Chromohalobacter canadensis]|uniref:hypothetical protein n=1 Tax=Chromohalobacter canadensis TaxID=141389 RepID=UPI00240FEDC6|nr:hypothetical protein [Chromohalobacter canadensis]